MCGTKDTIIPKVKVTGHGFNQSRLLSCLNLEIYFHISESHRRDNHEADCVL